MILTNDEIDTKITSITYKRIIYIILLECKAMDGPQDLGF